jgi:GPH family glycoside/pentoside/hexuronide:cation symporter
MASLATTAPIAQAGAPGATAELDPADRIALPTRIGWAAGSVGTITVLSTTSFLLLFYMTTVLGLGPALAGGLLFGAKLFDALIAPALGRFSDGFASKWGRRRPFLFAGAIACGLAILALFNPPVASGPGLIAWLVAGLLLLAAGYTLFNVPYLAMPAEMTSSPRERTALMSWRILFVSLGGALVGFAPKFAAMLGGGERGFSLTGAALGAIVTAAMLTAFAASARARGSAPPAGRQENALKVIAGNRPFQMLLAAKVFQLVGLAAMQASVLFLLKQVLGLGEGTIGTYVGATTLATLASMPLWVRLGRRFSKRDLFIAGCLAYALVKLSWLLAVPGEPMALVMARAIVGGLLTGGILLMGQSILPDAIDWDCRRSGVRREGVYAGAYSFVEKASMALGPLLIGLILAAVGFDPKAAQAGIQQGAAAIEGVFLGAAVLPALLYALSCVPLAFFRLDDTPAATGSAPR